MDSTENVSKETLYGRLFRGAQVYALGICLQQFAGILLLPIYLTFLSPAELGEVALGELVATVFGAVMGLGLHSAVKRFFSEWLKRGVDQEVSFGLWMLSCCIAGGLALILSVLGEPIFRFLLHNFDFRRYGGAILLASFLSVVTQVPLALLRMREEPLGYLVISAGMALGGLVATCYFVMVQRAGVLGVFYATSAGGLIGGILSLRLMVNRMRFGWRPWAIVESLRFSWPLIPGVLAEIAITRMDRFFLDKFVPLADIGVYSVAQKISTAGRLLPHSALKTATEPFVFRILSERATGKQETVRLFAYVWALNCWFALGTFLFGPLLVKLFITNGVYKALEVFLLPLVVLSLLIHLAGTWSVAPFIAKKSFQTMWVNLLSLFVCAILNLVLVPKIGALGSALAICVATAVLATGLLIIGHRHYPLPFQWGRFCLILASSLAIGLIVKVVGVLFDPGLVVDGIVSLCGAGLGFWLCFRIAGGAPLRSSFSLVKRQLFGKPGSPSGVEQPSVLGEDL